MTTPPHRFHRFLLRRLRCATLLFLALLVLLYAVTSIYYVVRICMIERPSSLAATAAAGGEGAVMTTLDVAFSGGAERHSGSARRTGIASEPYTHPYKLLLPGVPMMRQGVRNPSLPADVPLWEEHGGDGAGRATRAAVPARQRYVLNGLKPGRRYMVRLSFLGSPSVGFDLVLYHVRRSLTETTGAGGAPGAAVHGWAAAEPQDTELLVFATSSDDATAFSAEEEVWVDEGDAGDVRRVVRGGPTDAAGPHVAVVEVRPRALSTPADPYRVPLVRFNVELDPLSPSFLPRIAVPLITYVVWALIFLGYLGVYTFVSSGIAGRDADVDVHRD
ncbi:hypothetical protein NESM_000720400 [Novymonas esmeraldas]|uniref:Uncharacterized protein n=1 Tax=Novymonas esmeraldas TaxID=1808958 RepID=A0AAW0EVT2_9TRYP